MLRWSEEKLEDENSITQLYFKASAELENRKKLYEEFRRKLTDEELASLDDENIKIPLQRYLSIMAVGFFAGKPPIYKVHAYDEEIDKLSVSLFGKDPNDEEKVKEMEYIIKHITDYNDDGKEFLDLAFDYFVKRACYELLYKNEDNEIVYSKSDALETVAIWDYSIPKKLIGLYRIIQTYTANGEYVNMVELTTKKGKRYFQDTPEKRKLFKLDKNGQMPKGEESLFTEDKKKRKPQKWDELPVVAIENEHSLNIFESVDSLIKAYERVIQNSRNTFKYNDEAILKVVGYNPEQPMFVTDENGKKVLNPLRKIEDEQVLQSKVRYLDDNGDISWVLKDVNDSALQNHKKTLMDLICLCAFIPNMTDLGFTQADNNSALEKKFFSLQQLIADADGEFKKGLTRRWELIFGKFNKDKGKTYDFRNVEITLLRNMPSDTATDTTRALSLRGLLCDETVIGMLPDDLDPKNEIAKMEEVNKDTIDENKKKISNFNKNQKPFEQSPKEEVLKEEIPKEELPKGEVTEETPTI